jgi:hypothetical protein
VPSTRLLDKICQKLDLKPFNDFPFFEKRIHRDFIKKITPLLYDLDKPTLIGIAEMMAVIAKGKVKAKKPRRPILDIEP